MGFNRKPHYTRGVLLVGDSGGMVNPFNGEGIDYALEAGHMAAETVVQALARPEGPARERVLEGYAAALDAAYGGYFTLGRVFAKMIGNPTFMKQATKYGLPADRADEVHAQADGEPDRPARRRRLRPGHQRTGQDRPGRLARHRATRHARDDRRETAVELYTPVLALDGAGAAASRSSRWWSAR